MQAIYSKITSFLASIVDIKGAQIYTSFLP